MKRPSHRARFWLPYAAAWIPFLAIYTSAFALSGELPLGAAIIAGFDNALPFALWGLGVVWICGRLTWRPGRAVRFLGIHLGIAVLYATLAALSALGLFMLTRPLFALHGHEATCTSCIVVWQFFMGMMLYTILASLTYTFRTTARLREEERRARRAETLKAQAELQTLRAQLNPHFLFNTLHTLIALVRRDPAAAEDAIEQFADLLRYASRVHEETRDEIPLAEEWEFVQNYLALERLRLGSRLRVDAAMGEDGLECVVPSFCLQPLVENAIRHAVAPRAAGGTIAIRAAIGDGTLLLEVRDDGPGAHPEAVRANNRLGLRLVRQRLEALYGDRARFEVVTSPGAGFRVRLTLPVIRATPAVTSPDVARADR